MSLDFPLLPSRLLRNQRLWNYMPHRTAVNLFAANIIPRITATDRQRVTVYSLV